MAVHPNTLHDDLKEINMLDQYISVHVPSTLPQFKWLPTVLIGNAITKLMAKFLHNSIRHKGLIVVSSALTTAMTFAAIQATTQIQDIDHKRDHKTVLAKMKDFTPPFLDTSKIA